jgi:hypothetical protein
MLWYLMSLTELNVLQTSLVNFSSVSGFARRCQIITVNAVDVVSEPATL